MTSRAPSAIQRPRPSIRGPSYAQPAQTAPAAAPFRNTEYIDLTLDGPGIAVSAGYGGGSGLRIDVSNDAPSATQAPATADAGITKPSSATPGARPRLRFDSPLVQSRTTTATSTPTSSTRESFFVPDHDGSQRRRSPPPMPVRPGRRIPAAYRRPKVTNPVSSGPRKDVRPKPYQLDTPAQSPLLFQGSMLSTFFFFNSPSLLDNV
jgi:hypothetical protein